MPARLIRSFTEVLGLLNRGRFRDRLDQELSDAIANLQEQRSEKGTATITVTLKLNYQGERLDIVPAVKAKLPEENSFAGTPFWTQEGALSTEHPNQMDIEARIRDTEQRERA